MAKHMTKLRFLQQLVGLIGAIYGTVFSWNLTFDTIVPWLGTSPEWKLQVGFLLWLFFVWGFCAGVARVLFMGVSLTVILLIKAISRVIVTGGWKKTAQ